MYLEYGMYIFLWSWIVFVMKGLIVSLENVTIEVDMNVYSATAHHLN